MSDRHEVPPDVLWVVLGTSVLTMVTVLLWLAVLDYLERKKRPRNSSTKNKKGSVLKKSHKTGRRR
jgi:hypothetical protein